MAVNCMCAPCQGIYVGPCENMVPPLGHMPNYKFCACSGCIPPLSMGFPLPDEIREDLTYPTMPKPALSPPYFVGPRGTYKVEKLGVDWDPDNDNEAGYRQEVEYSEANLVGSKTDLEDGGHLPVIDLDLPCHLEPSTTPDHYHLYINKVVSWDKYVNLLNALRDAGLVSEKYVDMSVKRGQTFVRRPGVWKNPGEGDS